MKSLTIDEQVIFHNEIKEELIYEKLVDCLEKCLIYGHIRRVAD